VTVRYTKDHEWIRVENGIGTVGISEHAQEQLGDIVYVELPEVGREVKKGEQFAVVESVKAASEVYAPASGRIVEVNGELPEKPELVNQDAEGVGWFARLADASELDDLMDAEAYRSFLETLG
jgi:glycine cleavage system H protein